MEMSTMTPEENKALVRRWFTELDAGHLDIIDELVPDDYLDHNPAIGGLGSGRDGIRRYVAMLRAAFPDTCHTIEDQMAEGDRVMTRLTARGTFTGEILGYAPNGRVVEVNGIAVHRIANGRIVEHWAHLDMRGFMEQIADQPVTRPA
jgi:steroid delta-isomerase-like uncharacterized protein